MRKPPPKHSQFKAGQSGNPGGRPAAPEDVKKARQLTANEFTKLATKFLFMTRTAITEDLKRPEASMLELLVGGMVAKATQKQDERLATFIFDRVIGKVTEKMEVQIPRPTMIEYSDGTRVELGSELIGQAIDSAD